MKKLNCEIVKVMERATEKPLTWGFCCKILGVPYVSVSEFETPLSPNRYAMIAINGGTFQPQHSH